MLASEPQHSFGVSGELWMIATISSFYGAKHASSVDMTTAEFYRAEAALCRERAEKAKTAEREIRWRRLAEDYLRLATELEAAESPSMAPE